MADETGNRIVIWHPVTEQSSEVAESALDAWTSRGWVLLADRPQPDQEVS